MGLDDRDWYRDAQREREKQRQIDATRAKFSGFSRQHLRAKGVSPIKAGLIPMLVFWCVVMGLLFGLMTQYLRPKQAHVLSNGDLVLERARDGHFYTQGAVNGTEVRFLVDTGASLVTVSEAFARKASIPGGDVTTFQTANGAMRGRLVQGLSVAVGPLRVSNVTVGVGLDGGNDFDALLGQSFLSKFDITMGQNEMVLRAR
jgi:aspartyl protease family protein